MGDEKKNKEQDKKPDKKYVQPIYNPPPKFLPGFPKAKRVPGKTGMGKGKVRPRWIDDNGDILEWDGQHRRIERYNSRGRHLGEYDPTEKDKQTKPGKPDRIITPTINAKPGERSGMWEFYLTWFNKNGDDVFLLGDVRLPGVGVDKVREVFALETGEYPGDCLIVGADQIEWLKGAAKGVDFRLNDFDYFVEVREG